jgi:hypothetical protein
LPLIGKAVVANGAAGGACEDGLAVASVEISTDTLGMVSNILERFESKSPSFS